MTVFEKMVEELEARKDRSAWNRGVNDYALELVEELERRAEYEGRNPEAGKECREWMLNGAELLQVIRQGLIFGSLFIGSYAVWNLTGGGN